MQNTLILLYVVGCLLMAYKIRPMVAEEVLETAEDQPATTAVIVYIFGFFFLVLIAALWVPITVLRYGLVVLVWAGVKLFGKAKGVKNDLPLQDY